MKGDEDAPCDICRAKYSEPSNEMVFCDMCDVCVHQACYGVSEIPAGDWFCNPCAQNIRPECIFCPSKKGAMKQTKSGDWAHVSCALWIPEVSFEEPEKMDTIVNIEKIPKSRKSLICSLCHAAKKGACIQCYVKKCRTAYHVTCAFEFNLHMEMEDNESGEQDIKFESFCLTHTELHASGQNPHTSTCLRDSSRKRKLEKNENGESIEDKIATLLPHAKASLEEENRASTSYYSGIPVVSTPEETIGNNENYVQKMNDDRTVRAELFTEQAIKNLSSISKGTARKSFALPAKKNQKLSQILSKLNGKMARNEKGNKSKRASAPNKLSSPKKPRTKSIKQKTKAEIHPSPTQFAPHNEGNNTSQKKQPDSTEPQFSGTLDQQPFSNSPFDIRQLFPTPDVHHPLLIPTFNAPKKLTDSNSTINVSTPSSDGLQILPSSTSRNNQCPQSDIAAGFPANATSSTSQNDNFEEFSRYMKSLLQNLSFKKTLRVQQKIIALVVKECGVSSDDEFDAISLSSDE